MQIKLISAPRIQVLLSWRLKIMILTFWEKLHLSPKWIWAMWENEIFSTQTGKAHYLTETARQKEEVLEDSNFLAAFKTFNYVGKTKITSEAKFRAAEEPKSSHGWIYRCGVAGRRSPSHFVYIWLQKCHVRQKNSIFHPESRAWEDTFALIFSHLSQRHWFGLLGVLSATACPVQNTDFCSGSAVLPQNWCPPQQEQGVLHSI